MAGKHHRRSAHLRFRRTRGSRAEVFHGTAHHTTGGLSKKHLKKNKHGRIVSKRVANAAKRHNHLGKAGYRTKKGVFGAFKDGKKVGRTRRRSRR
jgi:hypothetical protein